MSRGRRRAAPRRRHVRRLAAVAVAAGLILGGAATASAVFLARDDAAATVRSGTVTLDWNASGVNQFSIPVTGLVPGGTAARLVDLRNVGTVPVSELQLAGTATTVGSSGSDGLQYALDRCSVAWTSPTVCGGTITTISVERPVIGLVALSSSPAFAVGGTDHLRFTFALPTSAPTGAQSSTGWITVTVTGNQVPGRQR